MEVENSVLNDIDVVLKSVEELKEVFKVENIFIDEDETVREGNVNDVFLVAKVMNNAFEKEVNIKVTYNV